MRQLKYLPVEFDAKSVKEDGTFEGYASTFGNVDNGADVVMPGAFTKSLTVRPANKIKMLWQHDSSSPIGTWTAAREDEKGLYVEGTILRDVQKGAECYSMMKEGIIDSMSIGYRTMDAEYASNGVRQLKELGLYEVSLVTFPMNDQATVTMVKNDLTDREIESLLRDEAKLSNRDAKAAVSVFRKLLRDGGETVSAHRDDANEEAITSALAHISALTELAARIRS